MHSTNHCCCFVYCSYKCSRASCIQSRVSVFHTLIIKFHDFADNNQQGMKHQRRGATETQKGMTEWIILLSRILQGLEPIPETITWKQLNAIKNPFSCDFYKNATRRCSRAISDDCSLYKVHFSPPQMSERQWIHDSSPYVKTLKSLDMFSENERLHQKLFLANGHLPGTFCRQL